jgi:hypothetical protein
MTTTTTTTGVKLNRAGIVSTKYLCPTDCRGARVKATTAGGSTVTLPWDYGADELANHGNAAAAAVMKYFVSVTADRVSLVGGPGANDGQWSFAVVIQY